MSNGNKKDPGSINQEVEGERELWRYVEKVISDRCITVLILIITKKHYTTTAILIILIIIIAKLVAKDPVNDTNETAESYRKCSVASR